MTKEQLLHLSAVAAIVGGGLRIALRSTTIIIWQKSGR
jgi:hypothetical protein